MLAGPLLALALLPAAMMPFLTFSSSLGTFWHVVASLAFAVAAFCGFTTWLRVMSQWILAIEISKGVSAPRHHERRQGENP